MDDRPTVPPASGAPSPPPRRRRWWLWALLIVIVLLIAYALLHRRAGTPAPGQQAGGGGGWHRNGGQNPDQPQPVTADTAKLGDMPIEITQIATVTPLATVTVRSLISGYLVKINFTEGQEVKRGDILAEIDPRLYQAALEQAQGTLAKDQASLKQAQVDLARYQLLGRQKSIQQQTIDDQTYTVQQYQGAVRYDLGQVAQAQTNLDYCHIRAPVDGRVGLRQVDLGNYITAGDTNGLVIETQLKPMSLIFAIPQSNIPTLMSRLGAGATLPVSAYNAADTAAIATDGAVSNVDTQVDTTTGTVKLRAMFPNTDEKLFPSAFANAHLLLDTLHDVLLVPTSAVQTGPSGLFVYLIKPDDTIEIRDVTTGPSGAGNTVIASGLASGDRVVTDGTDHLRAGTKITIPAAPKAADPNAQQHHAGHRHRSGGDQQPN